ncbi:hypothetical protein GWK47_044285 [Chionoecetes opilio]|uniref:Uncharacterized protein n=1 Tax=Chionoecetes opilio TaxID=41210 RepID=A0A8J4Y7F8_CHIOP|nr:hypothetical protein GWK47_044285 [Chionoecetes opilio]
MREKKTFPRAFSLPPGMHFRHGGSEPGGDRAKEGVARGWGNPGPKKDRFGPPWGPTSLRSAPQTPDRGPPGNGGSEANALGEGFGSRGPKRKARTQAPEPEGPTPMGRRGSGGASQGGRSWTALPPENPPTNTAGPPPGTPPGGPDGLGARDNTRDGGGG